MTIQYTTNHDKQSGFMSPLLCGLIILAAIVAILVVVSARPLNANDTVLVVSTNATPGPFTPYGRPMVHIDSVEGRLHIRILDTKGNTSFDRTDGQFLPGNRKELDRLKVFIDDYFKDRDKTKERAIIDRVASISRSADNIEASINNLWVLVCFVLIFMMQPGFAFLESGLIRFTNVINVLFKNTITTCICGVCFLAIGYSLMWNSSTALHGEFQRSWLSPYAWPNGISAGVHFLFQLAFAMTSATIISGAVAGRITLWAYLIITVCMAAFIYPISGCWAWSDHGWLKDLGFHDFAGSSVVHCVGGFAGLAGVILLGPRIALFTKGDPVLLNDLGSKEFQAADILNFNQSSNKPHSVGFATLGTFLLWMGWFGFNGGSELAMYGADGDGVNHVDRVGRIIMNTFISGCSGGVFAMIGSGIWTRLTEKDSKLQLDLEDVLNGVLGGCVAITAGCDLVENPLTAVLIGGLAGIFVFATIAVLHAGRHKLKIDDPVGAIAVHAVCGMLGTLACGFLGAELRVQALGMLTIGGWSFVVSFAVFWLLKKAGILRASALDEIRGLDRTYHGKSAYKF